MFRAQFQTLRVPGHDWFIGRSSHSSATTALPPALTGRQVEVTTIIAIAVRGDNYRTPPPKYTGKYTTPNITKGEQHWKVSKLPGVTELSSVRRCASFSARPVRRWVSVAPMYWAAVEPEGG